MAPEMELISVAMHIQKMPAAGPVLSIVVPYFCLLVRTLAEFRTVREAGGVYSAASGLVQIALLPLSASNPACYMLDP
jgi:hypothetical protein